MPEREEHALDSLLADADGEPGHGQDRMRPEWKRRRARRITAGIRKGFAAI